MLDGFSKDYKMEYIIYGLLSINFLAIILMARDKSLAKSKSVNRIAEKKFFLLAALGGSIGIFFAMYFFRHKTKHKCFVLGVPLIIALQVSVLFYAYNCH